MLLPTYRRDLDAEALTALVEDLAAAPERWRDLVCHRPDARTYAQLHRDDHVGVWLICWMNDHDTGFHDHDLSAGALSVVRDAVDVGGGEPAVTLHAYSPPLWRMGAYEVSPDGTLRRHSMSYAEELRPLDEGAIAA